MKRLQSCLTFGRKFSQNQHIWELVLSSSLFIHCETMSVDSQHLPNIGSTALIIATYLTTIKVLGSYMKDKKPYDLKQFRIWYNIYQIFACVFLMRAIQNTKVRFWGPYCSETHPDTLNPADERFIEWFSYGLKVSEMAETIVFLLRKKDNQVTLLHVFHHCVTVTFVYTSYAFRLKSGIHLALYINSLVHIFMYSYYLVAALCSTQVLQRIHWVKKIVTKIQIVQFVVILCQLVMHMMLGCKYPVLLSAYYGGVYLIFLYLFLDFYRNTYSKGNKVKQ